MTRLYQTIAAMVSATLAILALSGPLSAAESRQPVTLPITGVYDGDTLYARLPGAPEPLRAVLIRVYGIDTPERGWRAQCESERDMAERARELVASIVADATGPDGQAWAVIYNATWDKYGGRIGGEVYVDRANLGVVLIAAGLARPYDGGAREPWCTPAEIAAEGGEP